jgi:APA family basic amino acid/polyamine antiporter
VTFARYFIDLTGVRAAEWLIAAFALGGLTVINCAGVRAGSTTQSVLMVLKIAAIAALVGIGLLAGWKPDAGPVFSGPVLDRPFSFDLLTAVGAAMVPVLFAYGGWQTSCFIAGEMREPRRDLPRGLLVGVLGVVLLYLGVNVVCLRVLGTSGLAATTAPASDVMRAALGDTGAAWIAAGIAVSTLGFLSQSMLTAPRVYYAMARDGLFFRSVGRVQPRTRVPAVAIALQGACAIVIAVSGRYEQILNYVVSVDFIFFGLSAACIFGLRRIDAGRGLAGSGYNIPGHPVSTILFIAACWLVVMNTVYRYPANTLIGLAIMAAGVPVYFFWRWREARWTARGAQ